MNVDDQTRALTYVDSEDEEGPADPPIAPARPSGSLLAYDDVECARPNKLDAVAAMDDVDLEEFVRGLAFMRASLTSSEAGGTTIQSERCMDVVRRQRRIIASMAARQKLFSASLQPSSDERQ